MMELKTYNAYICENDMPIEDLPITLDAIVRSASTREEDDWSDNAQEFEVYKKSDVDEAIAEKDKEIAELKKLEEVYRWRKFSEEKPPTDGSYMCAYKNKNKEDGILLVNEGAWDGEKWYWKSDFWEEVIYWMPKPKAPEESNK